MLDVPDFETIPVGALEGAAVSTLSIPAGPLRPADVLDQYLARRSAGVRGGRLRVAGDWGRDDLTRSILYAMSDPRFGDSVLWALRKVSEARWPAIRCWWVMDASELLDEKIAMDELVERIAKLPFVPQPTEIVVSDPDPANLHAAVLDEIATRLDPEGECWIYLNAATLHDPDLHAAQKAVASCSSRWSVRMKVDGWQTA